MHEIQRATHNADGHRDRATGHTAAGSKRRSYRANKTRSFGRPGKTLDPRDTAASSSAGKRWHSTFDKRWNCYKKNRAVSDEEPLVAENTANNSDLLDELLGDDEDAIPSWEARTVRRFFEMHNEQSRPDTASATWAWLDDREFHSGRSRPLPRALDIASLRAALGQWVSESKIIA